SSYTDLRDLHSFPTRRSSDLVHPPALAENASRFSALRLRLNEAVVVLRPACSLTPPTALFGLVEQLAADQHAADFAGAGADFVELGVAQQAAGGEIIDVAVAAENLDGVQGHLGGALGGVENHAGGVLAGGLATVAGLCHGIQVGAAGV